MARKAATPRAKPATVRVRVNVRGEWGGEIVETNTDYATGGPLHPEVLEDVKKLKAKDVPVKDLPPHDPSVREGDERCIGDEIVLPFGAAVGYIRGGLCGVPDDVALSDPDGTTEFMESVLAGKARIAEAPVSMVVSAPAPATQAAAKPAGDATQAAATDANAENSDGQVQVE